MPHFIEKNRSNLQDPAVKPLRTLGIN
jgi:hypothetical protein